MDEWDREPSYMEFNSKEHKVSDCTIPYKQIINDINKEFQSSLEEYPHSTDTLANSREYTQKFFDHNKNVINYMAKEFDMRKSRRCIQKINVCKNW